MRNRSSHLSVLDGLHGHPSDIAASGEETVTCSHSSRPEAWGSGKKQEQAKILRMKTFISRVPEPADTSGAK